MSQVLNHPRDYITTTLLYSKSRTYYIFESEIHAVTIVKCFLAGQMAQIMRRIDQETHTMNGDERNDRGANETRPQS